jgi:hypothetical protein
MDAQASIYGACFMVNLIVMAARAGAEAMPVECGTLPDVADRRSDITVLGGWRAVEGALSWRGGGHARCRRRRDSAQADAVPTEVSATSID